MDVPQLQYEPLVRAALAEDIGPGDITTTLCVPAEARATATVLAKAPGVIAGLDICALAFYLLDPDARWEPRVADGFHVTEPPTPLAVVTRQRPRPADGRAGRPELFAARLSGVATVTARYVAAVAGTPARIVDTRKTTPGLRALEKYAVRVGGGL